MWDDSAGRAVRHALSVHVLYWRSTGTLFRHALAVTTNNSLAHYNLGAALSRAGRFKEAVEHYEQALKINPDFVEARNNLGNCLFQAGRFEEAIAHHERVLQIEPGSLGTHNNLGSALLQAGRVSEAIGQFEQVLRLKPDYPEVHYNLGIALNRANRVSEAIRHFEQALQLRPDYAAARNQLGTTTGRSVSGGEQDEDFVEITGLGALHHLADHRRLPAGVMAVFIWDDDGHVSQSCELLRNRAGFYKTSGAEQTRLHSTTRSCSRPSASKHHLWLNPSVIT